MQYGETNELQVARTIVELETENERLRERVRSLELRLNDLALKASADRFVGCQDV
jgi:hypothetical protein